jgi:hypothetical protein
MRRQAYDVAKGPQKMVAAHGRFSGQIEKVQREVSLSLDPAQDRGNPPLITRGWRRRGSHMTGEQGHRSAGDAERDFLECIGIACGPRPFG